MTWTQTDLDAIEAAIASGELTVVYADKRITYRSIAELQEARRTIAAKVETTRPVMQRRLRTRMGW